MSKPGFLYLIIVREFLNAGAAVFKVGRTGNFLKRMTQYPKQSATFAVLKVSDAQAAEKMLIEELIRCSVQRSDIGNEYFEGDMDAIQDSFVDVCRQFRVTDLAHAVVCHGTPTYPTTEPLPPSVALVTDPPAPMPIPTPTPIQTPVTAASGPVDCPLTIAKAAAQSVADLLASLQVTSLQEPEAAEPDPLRRAALRFVRLRCTKAKGAFTKKTDAESAFGGFLMSDEDTRGLNKKKRQRNSILKATLMQKGFKFQTETTQDGQTVYNVFMDLRLPPRS
jgi:hypothetical protein